MVKKDLGPRLATKSTPAPKRADPAAIRAQLLNAAATMQLTRDQVGRQLTEPDDEG